MATVTGLTAARMEEIEDASVVDGDVVGDNLILTRHDGSTINAGNVRGDTGATGPTGPAGSDGVDGDDGADGVGIPVGGVAGEILEKASSTDFDVVWSSLLRAMVLSTQAANYTLTAGDEETMVLVNSTSAVVVTVPDNTTEPFPIGTRISVAKANTGSVDIAGAVGVTVRCPSQHTPSLQGRGAVVELIKIAVNEWFLDGHGNLATSEAGWQTFTPDIFATVSGPNLGSSGVVRRGFYIQDSLNRVIGGATVRWGAGGGRGNGTYRLDLPVAGVNYDDNDASPIGAGSVGIGFVHTPGLLHFNSVTPSVNSAVCAINGGLFLDHNTPAGTMGNVHWHFAYEAA